MAMDMPPMTLEEVIGLGVYERPAYVQSKESQDQDVEPLKPQKNVAAKARSKAIMDTAFGVGVKTGMAWQLQNIDLAIKHHERELDTVYDFGHLVIQDIVIPPVITEARDLYNQDGNYSLRLSGAYYKIEYQARFSSVPPSWHEYLEFPKPNLDQAALMSALLPKNSEERHTWERAVTNGWQQGVEQANLMLKHGFDKMNRDFAGMIRFHTFVIQGKLTMPAIARESIPVTIDGQTMAVDETLLRITTLSEFKGEMANWSSTIHLSSSSDQIAVPLQDQTPVPTADR
jgi:defect in organelle trafficking protein DotC